MSKPDRALAALRVQAQFGLVEAGLALARAVEATRRAEANCRDLESRRDRALEVLRAMLDRPDVNALQMQFLRNSYRSFEHFARQSRDVLAEKTAAEEVARQAVVELRHRESALARVQERERTQAQAERECANDRALDDLWPIYSARSDT